MKIQSAFSGYSTDTIETDRKFYGETLGLELHDEMGGFKVAINGQQVFVYQKSDHRPATFTVLNLVVEDINAAVDELKQKGVSFERYDNMPVEQDEHGILRGKDAGIGPNIAWFKDPSGNILSLIEN